MHDERVCLRSGARFMHRYTGAAWLRGNRSCGAVARLGVRLAYQAEASTGGQNCMPRKSSAARASERDQAQDWALPPTTVEFKRD